MLSKALIGTSEKSKGGSGRVRSTQAPSLFHPPLQ